MLNMTRNGKVTFLSWMRSGDGLGSLNDWMRFYEASSWLSVPRAAQYIKERMNT